MKPLELRIEAARLSVEMASRQYWQPPLGEPASASLERLCQAAIHLAKLLQERDHQLQGRGAPVARMRK